MGNDEARLSELSLRQRPRHPVLPFVWARVMEYEDYLLAPEPHYQET